MFMCMLVYKMSIQIYDQISILRNCSKVKLCRAVSLGLGLKGVKIVARNVPKFGVHDFYPMGIQIYDQVSILRSTSKVKLHHRVFLRFGLKELKRTLNIVKVGVHAYHPNAHKNYDQILIPRNL